MGAVTDEGVDSINNETRQTQSSIPGGRLDTKVLTIVIQALGGLYVVNPLSFTLMVAITAIHCVVKRHYFFLI